MVNHNSESRGTESPRLYAEVIVDITHASVDRSFSYRIPESLRDTVDIGTAVEVPFGRGNHLRSGYVIAVHSGATYDPALVKEIAGVSGGVLSAESQLVKLAVWMKEDCGVTLNQTLRTVLPVRKKTARRAEKNLRLVADRERLLEEIRICEKKNYRARLRLLSALLENPVIPAVIARSQLSVGDSVIGPLVSRGIIAVDEEDVISASLGTRTEHRERITLNREQQDAVDAFGRQVREGDLRPMLLHGITGSGKTEVYMEMIRSVIDSGKQVILLIPEISLTFQTVLRFYERFGSRIAILHSRLSDGERCDQWEKAARGDVSIMIGPRSALFAPFKNLGLIIIDEEHEGSYKSEKAPRYHAVEVARKRAELSGSMLVLGSATPSLESYSRAMDGTYTLCSLHARAAEGSALPSVHVADMRRELSEGNKSVFSAILREKMEDRLRKKEQVMLFLNRRGYSGFISCRSCGKPIRCPHCDVSMTYHRDGTMRCHYCGYMTKLPAACPTCGSPYLAGFGLGTQKLEEMTAKAFPEARILRMDADTTAKKDSHREILEAFASGGADILIGTQMIVKGHDFPNVTLMGIMAADLSLNSPDFRSAERTFQLLTQAAGRAGRAGKPGEVVIQTYDPDHYAIRAAAGQDYRMFYEEESAYRKAASYPPAWSMMEVQFSSAREEDVTAAAKTAAEKISGGLTPDLGVRMIGPAEAPIYRLNDVYRKILYFKSENYAILIRIRRFLVRLSANEAVFRNVLIQCDML